MTSLSVRGHTRPRPRSVINRIKRLYSLWRQRRALGQLDDAALDDIGLSRQQAAAEARRPVWDAPKHWFR